MEEVLYIHANAGGPLTHAITTGMAERGAQRYGLTPVAELTGNYRGPVGLGFKGTREQVADLSSWITSGRVVGISDLTMGIAQQPFPHFPSREEIVGLN